VDGHQTPSFPAFLTASRQGSEKSQNLTTWIQRNSNHLNSCGICNNANYLSFPKFLQIAKQEGWRTVEIPYKPHINVLAQSKLKRFKEYL
jgi:hypothetical protein